MRQLPRIFENNRAWVQKHLAQDPEYFERMASSQSPPYLWVGCSDSRIPANEVVGLEPGQLFVHRNVANQVVHTDFNVLSVLEFGVKILKVKHIIVCGHYGCGGIRAAMENKQLGLLDNWLRHIRDVHAMHRDELDAIEVKDQQYDRLAELNTMVQVRNVCHTSIVQSAWIDGQDLEVHGVIYDIRTGRLKDLHISMNNLGQIDRVHETLPAVELPTNL